MREIKFRALVNGTWQYWEVPNGIGLENGDLFRKDTIGEYTGLKDKNGMEIFEGDVLRYETTQGLSGPEHTWHGPLVVEWKSYGWQPFFGQMPERCEIIGNIYENPELLK